MCICYTPRMRVFALLLCVALAAIPYSLAQTPTTRSASPDTILFNGTIYTGNGFAEGQPQTVQAMAIGGGKVLAIGSSEKIKRLAGPHTQLRDLGGSGKAVYVFPGFNDAHTHLGEAGQLKLNLDLAGIESLAAMLARIAVMPKPRRPATG